MHRAKPLVLALLIATLPALAWGAEPKEAAPSCGAQEFDVYFDEWQHEINADARAAINLVQTSLHGCKIDRVRIIGAAGARGDAEANLEVSTQRAQAIANALADGGWPRESFELAAIGEIGATAGDVSQPMRRRAHVFVEASAP